MTTAEMKIDHINPDEVVTLTQIMAANGDVPVNVGGWMLADGYAGATHRMNGVVGEVVYGRDTNYVCVCGSSVLCLPNSHPDYRPSAGTVWASVPQPDKIDWRYVGSKYHSRDGWRVEAGASKTRPNPLGGACRTGGVGM